MEAVAKTRLVPLAKVLVLVQSRFFQNGPLGHPHTPPSKSKRWLYPLTWTLMDEVIARALVSEPEAIEWSEDDAAAHEASLQGAGSGEMGVTAH